MVQIRNVPDQIHRELKARAALAGKSLSEYALGELCKALDKPTRAEVLARIAARSRVDISADEVVEAIRAERHGRESLLDERHRV